MGVWIRWGIFAAFCALALPVSAPARAGFGECSSAAYRASFDPRLASIEYDCVERVRVPVATSSGERNIRVLHDLSADWIMSSGEMREFDRGVRGAVDAMRGLGSIELEDVTILLADDFPPRADADTFSDVAAYTEFENDGECRIIVYLVGPASRPEYAAWVVAHEIFHCVQVANLRPEQLNTVSSTGAGSGGDWWIEGSATWFSALAISDRANLQDLVDQFDARSPTTPLNEMAYDAVPFFMWLGQDSPATVMGFIRGMASDASAPAQHAAMARALDQEGWLRFAQAYLDEEIRHPRGTSLSFAPQSGDTWRWSATRTQNLALRPFVLARGGLAFDCGRWRTSVRPGDLYRVRPEAERGPWETLALEFDTTSGGGGGFRLAAINATPGRTTLAIQGVKEAGCGTCAAVVETDSCLVGTWRLSAGGSAEWMRRQGVPGTYSTSNETITFRADGTYLTSRLGGQMQYEGSGFSSQGRMGAQAGGRWSTRDGALNLCADMQSLGGSTTITGRDGERNTIRVAPAAPAALQMSYACSRTTLSTDMPMPRGAPAMSSTYTREADAPSR